MPPSRRATELSARPAAAESGWWEDHGVGANEWTPYAPLGDGPTKCDFCGQPKSDDRHLVANHDGSTAICADCVKRFAALLTRHEQ
jgi:hypothetical protein